MSLIYTTKRGKAMPYRMVSVDRLASIESSIPDPEPPQREVPIVVAGKFLRNEYLPYSPDQLPDAEPLAPQRVLGNGEMVDHTEDSPKSEDEQAMWDQYVRERDLWFRVVLYQKEVDAAMRKRNEKLLRYILDKSILFVPDPADMERWAEENKEYGIEVPEDGADKRRAYILQEELDGRREFWQGLYPAIRDSGNMSPEAIRAAEQTFRCPMGPEPGNG